MVPTTLILVILTFTFFPAAWGYFWNWPKRRIANVYFLVLGSVAALMLFTVVLAIVGVQIVWLSWVLLVTVILLLIAAIRLFRRSLAVVRARDREIAERRARGP
jgi:hypothetical protein